MSIQQVERIDQRVPVRNVLVSVSDKSGLDRFATGLMDVNPRVRFLSTGGTFAFLQKALGERAAGALTQVAEYTGQLPETPDEHDSLVNKIMLTSAWVQTLLAIGAPLAVLFAFVMWRRRR